jgi:hypothetical protein
VRFDLDFYRRLSPKQNQLDLEMTTRSCRGGPTSGAADGFGRGGFSSLAVHIVAEVIEGRGRGVMHRTKIDLPCDDSIHS